VECGGGGCAKAEVGREWRDLEALSSTQPSRSNLYAPSSDGLDSAPCVRIQKAPEIVHPARTQRYVNYVARATKGGQAGSCPTDNTMGGREGQLSVGAVRLAEAQCVTRVQCVR
jgi:hypothetical protein